MPEKHSKSTKKKILFGVRSISCIIYIALKVRCKRNDQNCLKIEKTVAFQILYPNLPKFPKLQKILNQPCYT